MGRAIFLIFIVLILIIIMVPSMLFISNQNDRVIMKNNLNLAAKVLINAVDKQVINMDELGEGYIKSIDYEIRVDRDRLLSEFYEVLFENVLEKSWYEEIKRDIKAKIIVYNDRFYICDNLDRWSPPYYFIDKYNGEPLYLNTMTDTACYYDDLGDKVSSDISFFGISNAEKEDLIINKLNEQIVKYVMNEFKEGINIKIYNPHKPDGAYKAEYSRFNVLDGLTFFVVYVENDVKSVFDNEIKLSNYQIAGYTLEDY
ncbi:hypothetical protein [Wukongibacter sp. M2B1]|uniref:hypothetical protein n=1 Tax=Wukongibacter sp. M2B1 TaxID=3088895 RepID=UPI003D7B70C6